MKVFFEARIHIPSLTGLDVTYIVVSTNIMSLWDNPQRETLRGLTITRLIKNKISIMVRGQPKIFCDLHGPVRDPMLVEKQYTGKRIARGIIVFRNQCSYSVPDGTWRSRGRHFYQHRVPTGHCHMTRRTPSPMLATARFTNRFFKFP